MTRAARQVRPKSHRINGVILDLDGTLVDSNDAHARAWVEAFKSDGIEARFEDVRALIGMGGDKLIPRIAGFEEESRRGKRIGEERSRIFQERYIPALKAFDDARELLRRMRDEGLKLAVASSAKKEEMQELLAIVGAEDLVAGATSSDDAEESKPAPDIVEAALKRLGFPPDEVLMLGDTPYDIEAAARARVDVIAFRCGGWNDEKLQAAVAIYDGPADLLANYDASPLGSGREAEGYAG